MVDFHFKGFIDNIHSVGNEEFICVFREKTFIREDYRLRESVFAFLTPIKLSSEIINDSHWFVDINSFKPGIVKYSDEDDKYACWGLNVEIEPIVYQMFFNNIFPTKYNIIEEFILFFNLYKDSKTNTFIQVTTDSSNSTIIKIDENEILIRKNELKQFLALKKMVLMIQFDYYKFSTNKLSNYGVDEESEKNVFGEDYSFIINYQIHKFQNYESNSRLLGKKLINGYDNYVHKSDRHIVLEKEDSEYVSYITGIDGSGKNITNSSNVSAVKNPKTFYACIFFKSEVLSKYYQNPQLYLVEDSIIYKKGSWRLEIDNNNEDYVLVYLGDLGCLNYDEQCYWRSYNIIPVGNMSSVKFSRDILNKSTEPVVSDLLFKKYFKEFQSNFKKKYQFELFLELKEADKHHFSTIRRPLNEDINEFETILFAISKILNDSINIGGIKKHLNIEVKYKIEALEILLSSLFEGTFEIIGVLQTIQKFRSTGIAHRKGSDYNKFLKSIGYSETSHYRLIDDFLIKLSKAFLDLNKEL